jgi:signal transduction histidine kinase
MRSITRTLSVSLSLAAVAIFLVALGIVVSLDVAREPTDARCQAAVWILQQATKIGADGSLTVRTTSELEELKSASPELWYAVSSAGHLVEFATESRPALPFGLPYTGPIGRSVVDTIDHKGSVCLNVAKNGSSEMVVMLSGARPDPGQLFGSFVVRNLPYVLLLACAFAATVAAGATLSARFVARSIERVTRLALSIEPTAPRASIPLDAVPRELVALVSALNRAFDEIDAHMRQQRRFLGNTAHELRTPLTLLRAKIEDVPEPALRAELVRDIRRLTSLVSAMLDLARLQNQVIEKKAVNLSGLVREVLADFTPSALDIGVELSLEQERDEPVMVEGVEVALRSAIANLMSNALIHADGATCIVAELKQGSLTIKDDGAGLPPGHGSNLIEPFQKGESSKQGAGLGLSIAQEIMVAHGGSMTVASSPGQGTAISLRFPSASAAPFDP